MVAFLTCFTDAFDDFWHLSVRSQSPYSAPLPRNLDHLFADAMVDAAVEKAFSSLSARQARESTWASIQARVSALPPVEEQLGSKDQEDKEGTECVAENRYSKFADQPVARVPSL